MTVAPTTTASEHLAELAPEQVMERLQAHAYAQERQAFSDLVAAVDWPARMPNELLKALDLALYLGMARLAMKLAALAGQLFPEHERAQSAARVIRPAEVVGSSPASGQGLRASAEWFHQHAAEYRGQWVAVRDGQFLGAAPTLQELRPLIGEGEDATNTLVTKVLA